MADSMSKSGQESQSVEQIVQKMHERSAKRRDAKRKVIEDEFAEGVRAIRQKIDHTYKTEMAKKIKQYEAGAAKLIEILQRQTKVEKEIEKKVAQMEKVYKDAADEMNVILEGRMSDIDRIVDDIRRAPHKRGSE